MYIKIEKYINHLYHKHHKSVGYTAQGYMKRINISVSEETHTKAKVISVLKGITLNEYYETAINEALSKDKTLLEKLKKQI